MSSEAAGEPIFPEQTVDPKTTIGQDGLASVMAPNVPIVTATFQQHIIKGHGDEDTEAKKRGQAARKGRPFGNWMVRRSER